MLQITNFSTNTVHLAANTLLTEIFLGVSITFLLLHGTLIIRFKGSPLVHDLYISLSTMTLLMAFYLYWNDVTIAIESVTFNDSVVTDFLGTSTKMFLTVISALCLSFLKKNTKNQKINQFEYILLLVFAVLSLLLLISSDDLLTAYLAIELQAVSFYTLCSIKRTSSFSVQAGLNFFIIGSFSSSLFLFGSSLVYGVTGTINFEDLRDIYFWIFPGSVAVMCNIDSEFYQQEGNKKAILDAIAEKIKNGMPLSLKDGDFVFEDFCELCDDNLFWINSSYDQICINLIEKLIDEDLINYVEDDSPIWDQTRKGYIQNTEFTLMFIAAAADLRNLADNCFLNEITFQRKYDLKENPDLSSVEGYPEGCESILLFTVENCRILSIVANLLPLWPILEDDFQDENYFSKLFNFRLINIGLVFIVAGLFIKLAIVPFHLWMPNVYQGSPTGTAFFLAVVPKFAIFVLLIRIFYYSLFGLLEEWKHIFSFFTIITVIVGTFGGVEQTKLKSLMAYSSISNIGYSLMPFCTGTFEGAQTLLTYFYIYTTSNLCVWSVFLQLKLRNNYPNKLSLEITDLAQLGKSNKAIALLTTIALFSIAGLPPLVGFVGKIGIYFSCIQGSMFFLASTVMVFSVVGTFYYIRLIKIMYFENILVGKLYYPIKSETTFLIAFLVSSLLFFFVDPNLIFLLTYKIILLLTL